jgi:hypothetical protein
VFTHCPKCGANLRGSVWCKRCGRMPTGDTRTSQFGWRFSRSGERYLNVEGERITIRRAPKTGYQLIVNGNPIASFRLIADAIADAEVRARTVSGE